MDQTFLHPHHEDEENKEDKGGEVDRSQHWVGLLYF